MLIARSMGPPRLEHCVPICNGLRTDPAFDSGDTMEKRLKGFVMKKEMIVYMFLPLMMLLTRNMLSILAHSL